MREDERLRGWKSIAGHLGVTQSTAIRWSKQPGFPVMRSGTGGSVYASRSDLDRWLTQSAAVGRIDEDPAPDRVDEAPLVLPAPAVQEATETVAQLPDPRRSTLTWRSTAAIVTASALAIAAVPIGRHLMPSRAAAISAEQDTPPELQRRYIQARSEWAGRTPDGIGHSIAMFRAIIADHPDYAAGFTGLADAYILSCEFSNTDRTQAFKEARAAVTTAAALAPDDPEANRILGFLTYWTTRDIAAAEPYFNKAANSSGHLNDLWYGNALIDAGMVGPGLVRLNRAVLAAPDSPSVVTDYAVGKWQAGASAEALATLQRVERQFPSYSGAPSFAALFRLSAGDVSGYVDDLSRWSRLINAPIYLSRAADARAALASGGQRAVLHLTAYAPVTRGPFWHGQNLVAAIAASQLHDRNQLTAILRRPEIPSEHWRMLRFPAAAFIPWRSDPVVAPLLKRAFGRPLMSIPES